jgi:glutamate-1-semialdehyde 2,1-aminomutase
MAAGIATLEAIAAIPGAYAQLDARGAQLEQGLCEGARAAKISLTVNRVGSLLTAFFSKSTITDYASAKTSDTKRYAQFFHGMLERGVYLAPSQFEAAFVSLTHTEADIAQTAECAKAVLLAMSQ